MSKKELSYSKAQAELAEIADKLESEDIKIDELESLVKRGKELVIYCQEKLRKIEDSLASADD